MVDVKRLQEMYPSPGLAGRARYCVGGALLLHLGREATGERRRGPLRCWPEWMPTPPELADVLRGENPALTDGKAIDYAGAIVRLNDDGEFAASWAKLDEALRAGRDEPAAEAARASLDLRDPLRRGGAMKQRKPNYRDDPTTGPARGRRQAPPMRLQAERAEQMARARQRLLERRGAGASPLAVERMARRIELQRSRLLAGGRPSRSGPRFLGWQSARRELWQVPFGSHEVRAWYDPGTRMVATVLPAAGGPLRLRQPLHPEWVAPARRRDPRRQA